MKTMYYSLYARKTTSLFYILTLVVLTLGLSTLSADAQNSCTLVCPPFEYPVQVSINANCVDTLTAEELGAMPTDGCVGPFAVEIMDDQGNPIGDTINISMVGETYMVIVTSEAAEDNQQACMFQITVVDKQAPIVTCPDDVTISCASSIDSVPGIPDSNIVDCSAYEVFQIDELVENNGCTDTITAKYIRTYIVKDIFNNITTCTQMISLRRTEIGEIEFPPNITGDDAIPCFPTPDLSPDVTGRPTVDGVPIDEIPVGCNLLFTTFDTDTVPLCSGGYKVLREWRVMDWCTNFTTQSMQIIEVKDLTPPVVEVPDEIDVEAGAGCMADVLLPMAVITDDCGTEWDVRMQGPFGTIEQNGGLVEDVPAGSFDVIYIALTPCGQEGRDTLRVNITDEAGPSAICHAVVTVPLNSMGMTVAPAEAFDAGSFDNCGDLSFKVKRMSPPQGYSCFAEGNPFYAFDDDVKFCCEDIENGPIMVIMRVYDVPVIDGVVPDNYQEGRFSDCMVTVEVQDKIGPEITCPPDLTISCMYPFDPDNLSVFGTIVQDPSDREEVCIDDPGDNNVDPVCWGLDGLATDNCEVSIREEAAMIMDSLCGTGEIIRTFTATDPGGRSVVCQQRITIMNFNPFNEGHITWPESFVEEDICDVDALDPEDLPPGRDRPIISDDACDLVAVNHFDEVLDFSGSSEACFKILRTWVVIDWCQYGVGGSTQNGRWEYLQTIKVKNTVPPTILMSADDVVVCADDPGCGDAVVELSASATDDCTDPETFRWRISIDEDNNGTIDDIIAPLVGESIATNYSFPIGTHRVLYSVQDFCGNTTVEEQIVTVESCAIPSAKCQNITVTLMATPEGGSIVIWASDLDAGSDHPCGLDVTVAFSPDPNNTNLEFTCDDLGENSVDLYVIDETGATDFCTVTVTVQDNSGVCSGGLTGTISGEVHSSSALQMDDVMIKLDGSGMDPVYTDDGAYSFGAMPLGGVYKVTPELNTNPTNGISTIDLIKIQKHLLGIEALDSPYKLIAADANRSGSVSAVDILELKKLILGVTDELPNNTSWRFVDSEYDFINPLNPFDESIPESYQIDPFTSDMNNVNFVGIKIGDVNESAQVVRGEGTTTTGRAATTLSIEDVYLQAGEIREVTVHADQLKDLETLQFTMGWDRTRIDIMEVIPGNRSNAEQWNARDLDLGVLPFSWHKLEVPENDESELITLRIRAVRTGALSESLTLTSQVASEEALVDDGSVVTPELQFGAAPEAEFTLYQNVPNPFSDFTQIPFDTDEDGAVAELVVYDLLGKMVFSTKVETVSGRNMIDVPATSLQAQGLLIYTLKINNSQQTKRMIIETK